MAMLQSEFNQIELLTEIVDNVTDTSNTYINVEGNASHAYVAFVDIAGYVSVYSILTSTSQIRTVSVIYEDTHANAPKLANDGNACKINTVSSTTPRTAHIKYIKFY